MKIGLCKVKLPDFGVPQVRPAIPAATLGARCDRLHQRAGCDWVVVYADREHLANMVHLTGFEPRFEEALLLLGPGGRRIAVAGNESLSYAQAISPLPGLEVVLAQSLSLMAQDRSARPRLTDVLREAGLRRGDTIGIVGWKYLEPEEWDGPPAHFVPHHLVAMLEQVAGGGTTDVTHLLMHPQHGDRSVVDADQIAQFEWGAARASHAVQRLVGAARPGMSELEAASHMGYAGEPLSCHAMFSCASAGRPIVGLASPSARRIAEGDGVTAAIGYWGGLSCRAGMPARRDDAFLPLAKAYFRGLMAWYDTARIGVAGGDIHAAVAEALAAGGLQPMLNPGHLVSYDEWSHSPIRPGARDTLASGMPMQVDIIPTPLADGLALNCEDTVVIADAALRAELASRHPEVWNSIEARRAFVRDGIGVDLDAAILPLSSIPLAYAPFWLAHDHLLVAE
jgi:hypothetical protein